MTAGSLHRRLGLAISSGSIIRCNRDDGRALAKNSTSICSDGASGSLAMLFRKSIMPSERVGPGSTEFTVTFVPLVSPARPRDGKLSSLGHTVMNHLARRDEA